MIKRITFFFALLFFCGCKTKVVTVPVETVRTDTLRELVYERDSIFLRDSTWVSEHQRGDTIFVTKEKWHTVYQDRTRTDTVYVSKTDSVQVPVVVEVEKKATLPTWLKLYFVLMGALVIGVLVYFLRKIFVR